MEISKVFRAKEMMPHFLRAEERVDFIILDILQI